MIRVNKTFSLSLSPSQDGSDGMPDKVMEKHKDDEDDSPMHTTIVLFSTEDTYTFNQVSAACMEQNNWLEIIHFTTFSSFKTRNKGCLVFIEEILRHKVHNYYKRTF